MPAHTGNLDGVITYLSGSRVALLSQGQEEVLEIRLDLVSLARDVFSFTMSLEPIRLWTCVG